MCMGYAHAQPGLNGSIPMGQSMIQLQSGHLIVLLTLWGFSLSCLSEPLWFSREGGLVPCYFQRCLAPLFSLPFIDVELYLVPTQLLSPNKAGILLLKCSSSAAEEPPSPKYMLLNIKANQPPFPLVWPKRGCTFNTASFSPPASLGKGCKCRINSEDVI